MSRKIENKQGEPQTEAEPGKTNAISGKRNSLVLIVVVVAVAAMLALAPYMARQARNNSGNPSSQIKGKLAPEFSLESLQGQTVHLADFRGKAVLLNFWATWCQPCKIEMPWLEEMQQQYGPQGLQIVGIAMDDASKEEIAKFAKEMGVNYPILLGKESVGDAYGGVQFLPSTFFIDRKGKLVDRVFGLKSRSEIEEDIKLSLGQANVAER